MGSAAWLLRQRREASSHWTEFTVLVGCRRVEHFLRMRAPPPDHAHRVRRPEPGTPQLLAQFLHEAGVGIALAARG